MNSHFKKLMAVAAAVMLSCIFIGGCSSDKGYYHISEPEGIGYTSIYLNLKVADNAIAGLGDVSKAMVYTYGKDGQRLAATDMITPAAKDGRRTFTVYSSVSSDTATLDFYDSADSFLGCSTVQLPEMGKDLNVSVEINTICPAAQAAASYSLALEEEEADPKVGGDILLEAVLTTPCGKQIVTDNSSAYSLNAINAADWHSSDNAVISKIGNGIFRGAAAGTADIICDYNGVLSSSRTYTIAPAE